jgi:hypothetical protein
MDNHIITWNPIDRCGHFVLIASLQRINHPKNLGGIAAGRSRVGESEANGLLWVDDKD